MQKCLALGVRQIYAEEGLLRLYRGLPAVILGAIPSHAVHFATLEFTKSRLGLNDKDNTNQHQPVRAAIAGASAAMAHDAVVTPADLVKQVCAHLFVLCCLIC